MKTIGLHARRLKDPEFHAREVRFAKWWEQFGPYTLPHLLGDGLRAVTPSDRDATVAATVIQWLGSNVGMSFLSDCGFEYRKPPDENGSGEG